MFDNQSAGLDHLKRKERRGLVENNHVHRLTAQRPCHRHGLDAGVIEGRLANAWIKEQCNVHIAQTVIDPLSR